MALAGFFSLQTGNSCRRFVSPLSETTVLHCLMSKCLKNISFLYFFFFVVIVILGMLLNLVHYSVLATCRSSLMLFLSQLALLI